tara:strand:+ start:418 stop:717 length:300 start_codon:yes stop_codon:yes gene_type:complete
LIIKKNDISSIFPIIINIIIETFDVVNKFEKLRSFRPYKSEFTVFVSVKIDNLKDFSKSRLSADKKLDKIRRLIKKEIKTKNEIFIFSIFILFSVFVIL